MSLDDHKKNMATFLEEKSNLLQYLSYIEKQIQLVRVKDSENCSQLHQTNTEDKDYNNCTEEEDYFYYLVDHLTDILEELSIVNKKIAVTRTIFERLLRLSISSDTQSTPCCEKTVSKPSLIVLVKMIFERVSRFSRSSETQSTSFCQETGSKPSLMYANIPTLSN